MANVSLENAMASIANAASQIADETALEGKFILLFDSSGQVVGKVDAGLFAFMGSSASSAEEE